MLSTHEKSTHTESARALSSKVRKFVDEMIIPNESRLAEDGEGSSRLQSELTEKAGVPDYGVYFIRPRMVEK